MAKEKKQIGAKDKFGYMMGDFGCNMSFQLISSFLMLFVTQALGISMVHWMVIVVVAKVFDAINDPIIGALVDKKKPGKHGKFKPWIFVGSFFIAITTVLLFTNVSGLNYWFKFAYCLIMYMVWSVAYTVANVPYGSLNAALTDNAKERSSLSSLRSIGAGLAMLPIMVAVPLLVYNDDKTLKANMFMVVALLCGIFGIIGFMMTIFMTKEKVTVIDDNNQPKEKISYVKTLKSFFKNKAVLALCLASFAQLVFILTFTTTVQLVFQFYFQNTKLLSVVNIVSMLPMVVFIPFMPKLTAKFGNKKICSLPNIVGFVSLILMLFIPFNKLGNAGPLVYILFLMVAMLGGGTFTLATWSMVAECVDEQEVESGVREEASIYATYSLARKVAQGVGAGLVALCLSFVGYKTDGFVTEQDMITHNSQPGVAQGILILSIILPLIGYIVVFIAMQFLYKLDKEKVASNTFILRDKHSGDNIDVKTPTRCFYEETATEVKEI